MGLLQDGSIVVLRPPLSSGTGSLLTAHRDQMAKVVSGLKLGGTISMYRLPVRGRTHTDLPDIDLAVCCSLVPKTAGLNSHQHLWQCRKPALLPAVLSAQYATCARCYRCHDAHPS